MSIHYGNLALALTSKRPDAWAQRHNRIVTVFTEASGDPMVLTSDEVRILKIAEAIFCTITTFEDGGGIDYINRPAIGQLLDAFRTFLNYELNALDGGTLDSFAVKMADRIGWDLDLEEPVS